MSDKINSNNYKPISLFAIAPDEPLPFAIAVHFEGRFIPYRSKGQAFEVSKYNRFIYKRIAKLYVLEEDYQAFKKYSESKKDEEERKITDPSLNKEQRVVNETVIELDHATKDLFLAVDDASFAANTAQVISIAKNAVARACEQPYLRIFESIPEKANTVVAHSMRVSLMSSYLAYQLGFVNQIALEHIAAAGMLHDIGKTQIQLSDDLEMTEEQEVEAMRDHPILSAEMVKKTGAVPEDVIRVILEHHENRNGTGYPNQLRGRKMHGLSRVFVIANTFDNLVSTLVGTREQRYAKAADMMQTTLRQCFEPTLLPKALRLLTGQDRPR